MPMLKILGAVFGIKDVTFKVRELVKDNQLKIQNPDNDLGDCYVSFGKPEAVVYQYGNELPQTVVSERGAISITYNNKETKIAKEQKLYDYSFFGVVRYSISKESDEINVKDIISDVKRIGITQVFKQAIKDRFTNKAGDGKKGGAKRVFAFVCGTLSSPMTQLIEIPSVVQRMAAYKGKTKTKDVKESDAAFQNYCELENDKLITFYVDKYLLKFNIDLEDLDDLKDFTFPDSEKETKIRWLVYQKFARINPFAWRQVRDKLSEEAPINADDPIKEDKLPEAIPEHQFYVVYNEALKNKVTLESVDNDLDNYIRVIGKYYCDWCLKNKALDDLDCLVTFNLDEVDFSSEPERVKSFGYQRLTRISDKNLLMMVKGEIQRNPDNTTYSRLIKAGLDSCINIISCSRDDFVRRCVEEKIIALEQTAPARFSPKIRGNRIKDNSLAASLYDRAKLHYAKLSLHYLHYQQSASPYVKGKAFTPSSFSTDKNYQDLFGKLDYFNYEAGQSIYGPAAYFFDLMRIVNDSTLVRYEPTSPEYNIYRLRNRRPDLFEIPLDNDHAQREVPYLTLVNNTLARYYRAGDKDLVTGSAKQVATYEQTLDEFERYEEETFKRFTTSKDLFSPPLVLPLTEMRSYLNGQLGTSLSEVLLLNRPATDIFEAEAISLKVLASGEAKRSPLESEAKTGAEIKSESATSTMNLGLIVREYLNISAAEWDWLSLITKANNDQFTVKILKAGPNNLSAQDFYVTTGLIAKDLLDVIPWSTQMGGGKGKNKYAQFYINDTREKQVVRMAEKTSDERDLGPMCLVLNIEEMRDEVHHVTQKRLQRLAIFTFLAKKLDIAYLDLQLLMNALSEKSGEIKLDEGFFLILAKVKWLMDCQQKLTIEAICTFVGYVPDEVFNRLNSRECIGVERDAAILKPTERNLIKAFKMLLPNTGNVQAVETSETQTSLKFVNRLLTALKISATDFLLLVHLNGAGGGNSLFVDEKYTDRDLVTWLYRMINVAQLCDTTIMELLKLADMQHGKSDSVPLVELFKKLGVSSDLNKVDLLNSIHDLYQFRYWVKDNKIDTGILSYVLHGKQASFKEKRNTDEFNAFIGTLNKEMEVYYQDPLLSADNLELVSAYLEITSIKPKDASDFSQQGIPNVSLIKEGDEFQPASDGNEYVLTKTKLAWKLDYRDSTGKSAPIDIGIVHLLREEGAPVSLGALAALLALMDQATEEKAKNDIFTDKIIKLIKACHSRMQLAQTKPNGYVLYRVSVDTEWQLVYIDNDKNQQVIDTNLVIDKFNDTYKSCMPDNLSKDQRVVIGNAIKGYYRGYLEKPKSEDKYSDLLRYVNWQGCYLEFRSTLTDTTVNKYILTSKIQLDNERGNFSETWQLSYVGSDARQISTPILGNENLQDLQAFLDKLSSKNFSSTILKVTKSECLTIEKILTRYHRPIHEEFIAVVDKAICSKIASYFKADGATVTAVVNYLVKKESAKSAMFKLNKSLGGYFYALHANKIVNSGDSQGKVYDIQTINHIYRLLKLVNMFGLRQLNKNEQVSTSSQEGDVTVSSDTRDNFTTSQSEEKSKSRLLVITTNVYDDISVLVKLMQEDANPEALVSIGVVQSLAELRQLQNTYNDEQNLFLQCFIEMHQAEEEVSKLKVEIERNPNAEKSKELNDNLNKALSKLNKAIKQFLSVVKWEEQAFGKLNNYLKPANLKFIKDKIQRLKILQGSFDLLAKFNGNIDLLLTLTGIQDQPNYDQMGNIAGLLKKAISSQDNTDSEKLTRTTQALMEAKRDMLLQRIFNSSDFILPPGISKTSDLSQYLLLDLETSGINTTSFIAQGIASLQLYLQRCRLSVEKGVRLSIPEPWWTWLESYRLWEANRKVLLHPENYIEPELRKSQSDEFREFTQSLLQSALDNESIENAFKAYFNKLVVLGDLVPCEAYAIDVDQLSGKSSEGIEEVKEAKDEKEIDTAVSFTQNDLKKKIVFLFSRTRRSPSEYYFCKTECDPKTDHYLGSDFTNWTCWEKIDVRMAADYITPVYAYNRLFVFWVELQAESNRYKLMYSYQESHGSWAHPQQLNKNERITNKLLDRDESNGNKKWQISTENMRYLDNVFFKKVAVSIDLDQINIQYPSYFEDMTADDKAKVRDIKPQESFHLNRNLYSSSVADQKQLTNKDSFNLPAGNLPTGKFMYQEWQPHMTTNLRELTYGSYDRTYLNHNPNKIDITRRDQFTLFVREVQFYSYSGDYSTGVNESDKTEIYGYFYTLKDKPTIS